MSGGCVWGGGGPVYVSSWVYTVPSSLGRVRLAISALKTTSHACQTSQILRAAFHALHNIWKETENWQIKRGPCRASVQLQCSTGSLSNKLAADRLHFWPKLVAGGPRRPFDTCFIQIESTGLRRMLQILLLTSRNNPPFLFYHIYWFEVFIIFLSLFFCFYLFI